MLIFVDTQILIWGVRQFASAGQEGMIDMARAFFQQVQAQGDQVGIAAPTLAEYLVRTPEADRQKVVAEFQRCFCVYPFDCGAAAQGAQLWSRVHGGKSLGEVAKEIGARRYELKVDHQVVSIAVHRGASRLYTHDEFMLRFAKPFIRAEKLPPTQGRLPLELEPGSAIVEIASSTDDLGT
ncbi:MAG: hypothetical protein ACM309_09815 [Bacillota bacterium]